MIQPACDISIPEVIQNENICIYIYIYIHFVSLSEKLYHVLIESPLTSSYMSTYLTILRTQYMLLLLVHATIDILLLQKGQPMLYI